MRGKIFSRAEADRMVPLIKRIVLQIRARHRLIKTKQAVLLQLSAREVPDSARTDLVREVRALRTAMKSAIQELEALGVTLRDADRGVVEVYGELRGEIVFLTWMPGEATFGGWHPLDSTYLKRQLLDPVGVPLSAQS